MKSEEHLSDHLSDINTHIACSYLQQFSNENNQTQQLKLLLEHESQIQENLVHLINLTKSPNEDIAKPAKKTLNDYGFALNSMVYCLLSDCSDASSYQRVTYEPHWKLNDLLTVLFNVGAQPLGDPQIFSSPLALACLYCDVSVVRLVVERIKHVLSKKAGVALESAAPVLTTSNKHLLENNPHKIQVNPYLPDYMIFSHQAHNDFHHILTDALITCCFHQNKEASDLDQIDAIATYLIAQGASVNGRADILRATNRSPMLCAAQNGLKSVYQRLYDNEANPTATNYAARTPLHEAVDFAIKNNHSRSFPKTYRLQFVEYLLKLGATVNAQDSHGITPLHIAATAFDKKLCALLLRYGATPNIVDDKKQTPLDLIKDQMEHHPPLLLYGYESSRDKLLAKRAKNFAAIKAMLSQAINKPGVYSKQVFFI